MSEIVTERGALPEAPLAMPRQVLERPPLRWLAFLLRQPGRA